MIIDLRKKKLLIITALIFGLLLILNSNYFWQLFYPIEYKDLIGKYSRDNDVDPFLVAAIIKTESKYDPKVQSKRGAIGLMQIMPETGQWIAEQMKLKDFKTEDLYNEETNIKLGAWYVANLIKQFDDEVIAISAYNAGRGNVKRWLQEDIWDGTVDNLDQIPFSETQNYTKKVLNYKKTYKEVYEESFSN